MRGVICERFGWPYQYLMHEIPWLTVYYMMIDAPQFVPDDPKDISSKTKKTSDKPVSKEQRLLKYLKSVPQ